MYELKPIYDSRKSFYKKAMVDTSYTSDNYTLVLYSYGTKVAMVTGQYSSGVKQFTIYGFYSVTTLRHITEFYRQEYSNIPVNKKYLERYCL